MDSLRLYSCVVSKSSDDPGRFLMIDTPTGPSRAPLAPPSGALAAKAAKNTVGNSILVHKSQKGNPVLEYIKGVPWEYNNDLLVDYQVGSTTGVLYLSLKYHHLHTQYIFTRFEKLGRNYDLRILLILCDVTEHQGSIRELTKACLLNKITVVVAWSAEEVGQYLATYKLYEFKSHQLIKERVDVDYSSVLRAALTSVRGVNKTDVMTLRTNFGSFSNIVHAATEDMQLCPGFGPTKVRRLREAFNKPFYSTGQKPLGTQSVDEASVTLSDGEARLSVVDQAIPHEGQNGRTALTAAPSLTPPQTHRYSSPEWDVELTQSLARTDVVFDLELELNPSDEDTPMDRAAEAAADKQMSVSGTTDPPAPKKRRAET